MTYDPVAVLARFAARNSIGYTMLSDKGSTIIRAFGLINERMAGTPWYGIAHPMLVVLDGEGVVRHRFSKRNYTERPEPEAVLGVLARATGR